MGKAFWSFMEFFFFFKSSKIMVPMFQKFWKIKENPQHHIGVYCMWEKNSWPKRCTRLLQAGIHLEPCLCLVVPRGPFFFFFFLRGTLAAFLIACDQSLACPEKRIDDDDSRMNSPVVARYPSCHHKISTPFLNLLHMCVCAREREVAVAILRIHALLLSLEVDSMRFWLIWGPTAASGKLACPPRIRPLLVSTTV